MTIQSVVNLLLSVAFVLFVIFVGALAWVINSNERTARVSDKIRAWRGIA